jgi:hypothetical protein
MPSKTKLPSLLFTLGFVLFLGGACTSVSNARSGSTGSSEKGVAARVNASTGFWQHWGDGKAEMSGYRITTSRYGQLREGQLVLIYVTEPHDKRSLIKDDRVEKPHRVNMLKLNSSLTFRTGIYPYSVMMSVFSPVNGNGRERFAPEKISFSAQEWCGHVYQVWKPKLNGFANEIRSYFASEGDKAETIGTKPHAIYEDALLIQLRELDGPFNKGKNWSGDLVPSMWTFRKMHQPPQPLGATINRSDTTHAGKAVTLFEINYGTTQRKVYVEKAFPRRVVAWKNNDGEEATLLKTARLPYWMLNKPGNESYLKQIGL